MQSDNHADPRDTLPEAPIMSASTSDPAFYRPYSAPLYSSLPNGVPMHLPPPHSFQPLAHTFQPLVNHAYSAHLPPITDARFSSSRPVEEDIGDSLKASTSGKTFVCSGFDSCSMAFSRSEHLARHVRKHTGEKPFTCRCGKKFTRLDNLRQHASTIHHDEPEANEELFAQLSASMPRAGRNVRRKSSQQKRPASASTGTPTSSSPSVLRQQQTPTTADAALRHEAFQRSATSSGSTTPALSPEYLPSMPQSAPPSTSQPGSPALRMPVGYCGNTSAHLPPAASPSIWPYAYSQARYGASTLPQHGMPVPAPPAYPYHYVHSASTSHTDPLRYPTPYGHSQDSSHAESSINHGYSYSLRADPHVEPINQADQSLHTTTPVHTSRGQEQAQGDPASLDRGNEPKDVDRAAAEGQQNSSAATTKPVLPSLSSLIAGAPVAANASLELRPLTPRSANMSEHANKPTSEVTGHAVQLKPWLMQPQYSSSTDMSRSSSLSSMGGYYAMPAVSPSTTLSGTSPSTRWGAQEHGQ